MFMDVVPSECFQRFVKDSLYLYILMAYMFSLVDVLLYAKDEAAGVIY